MTPRRLLPAAAALALLAGPLLPAPAIAAPPEVAVEAAARTALGLTIYNQDLALVKDRRRVELAHPRQALAFAEVSPRALPETVMLATADAGPGLAFGARVFDFDLLTRERLLEAAVGHEVGIEMPGEETPRRARLLSFNNGQPVLEMDGRIHAGAPGRIIFDGLPPGVRTRPTLLAEVARPDGSGADRELELAYLTSGLNWRADYVAELNSAEDRLDLSAWATLANTTGTDFLGASVKLVAGDLNRARAQPVPEMMMARAAGPAESAMEPPQALMGMHVYSVAGPVDLPDRQTRQLALMAAPDIEVRRELIARLPNGVYRGHVGGRADEFPARRDLVFENTEAAGLGQPLPAGTVRVYRRDADGDLVFVGEDGLDHTGQGRSVRLTLGEDFDVAAKPKQVSYRKLSDRVFESQHEVALTNGKGTPVEVRVIAPIPGEWEMLEENHHHQRTDAATAEWTLTVPAEQAVTLTYAVRARF
ncbi:DUF4139 domain-containing protein [Roseospirillum parvum]|uniref:DUF4139 domain-containing protein n=1 Tax=Roseospirillum parvum TaxID=83401 RepID=A0A1G8FU03_9PROT|nr:DUF4139 domain-containing protein [Roseospirillum parvum]SDH85601.1 hypothetical protein SAMN05421742_11620 [Roseospirillum parvum]